MNYEEKTFLLKVTNSEGKIVEIIVNAENELYAVYKFCQNYSGTGSLRKVEISAPLLIL